MRFKTPEILKGAVNFKKFSALLRKEKNYLVLKILFFIQDLYYGLSVPEACEKHNISKETGYKYARVWRTEGINGLIPKYGDGRPSKLNENELLLVKNEIRVGKIHDVDDLVNFILSNFKVNHSKSWCYEFLRDLSLVDGIKYPLPFKEETAEDLEEINLKNKKYEIFINDDGLECLKVSKVLYFIRHEEINQVKGLIKNEKNNKLLKRYLFVNLLNNGVDLKDASEFLGVSVSNCRLWLKYWNESGFKGLHIEWNGGRPSFLNDGEKEVVKDFMRNNHVTRHSEVHKFILERFGVNYSMNHMYGIVKKN
jgi:putative transposase